MNSRLVTYLALGLEVPEPPLNALNYAFYQDFLRSSPKDYALKRIDAEFGFRVDPEDLFPGSTNEFTWNRYSETFTINLLRNRVLQLILRTYTSNLAMDITEHTRLYEINDFIESMHRALPLFNKLPSHP